MTGFEYKVVPAPVRGLKAKGIKTTQDRFANALQTVMNEHGAEGWEYQRTDTLPVEERQGLTGKTTTFQNLLVFRRALPEIPEQTPEIAALIEDHSVPAVPVEDAVPAQDESEVEAGPKTDTAPHEDLRLRAPRPDTPANDTVTLDARMRVSETLKAPLSLSASNRNGPVRTDEADTSRPPAD